MPNVSLAAGFRVAAVLSFSLIAGAPVSGQGFSNNPYDQTRVFGYSSRGLMELEESMPMFPDSHQHVTSGASTISADMRT